MRKILFFFIISVLTLIQSCTNGVTSDTETQESDSLYQQAAMSIYAYQPVQALHIIDSAVATGCMHEWKANLLRTRIYSSSLIHDKLDSLLGGPTDIRLDTARAIGERLLSNDSVKSNLKRQLDVLEMLANTARMQNDTTRWLQRSREFVSICHQLGASQETNALRTEAEIGAALCALGDYEHGMAKLDSAIYQLDSFFQRQDNPGTFKELDALIIALKRKIVLLSLHEKYTETLPLARLIIERLDDYEQNPDRYHDGSYREPKNDQKRSDYILFYRNQAQSFITAAYMSFGKSGNMLDAFSKIENSVREVMSRENIARYNSLQMQMQSEKQIAMTHNARLLAASIGILALMFFIFSVVVFIKNRAIDRKNHLLALKIADAANFKKLYYEEKRSQVFQPALELNPASDEQFLQYIHNVIVCERLFLNPNFDRQAIMDRFHLSKERVGVIFSKYTNYSNLNSYIQHLRLEYAAKLLIEKPQMSIVQIATESGFSSSAYFTCSFRKNFSMTPSEYRRNVNS